jgi:hypothetical protein
MPRYILHLRYRDGIDGLAVDEEGDCLPNAGGLRQHVEATAWDLIRQTRLAAIPDWRTCIFEGDRRDRLPRADVAVCGGGGMTDTATVAWPP